MSEKVLDVEESCKTVVTVGVCQGVIWNDATVEIGLTQKVFSKSGDLIMENTVFIPYEQWAAAVEVVNTIRDNKLKEQRD
jgi:hypothetical protein